MTVYQKIIEKIESLKKAEAKCLETGALSMAFTWRMMILDLRQKANKLPVGIAASAYNPKKYVQGLVKEARACRTA